MSQSTIERFRFSCFFYSLFIGGAFLFSPKISSAEIIERSLEVKTETSNPVVARRELMDLATERVSEDLIKEIIGEAKFNRNRGLIKSKVYKLSGRYIPWSKASELKPAAPGFSLAVQLRVQRQNLEALLLEQGLFYESDGTPLIMPFVQWIDRVQMRSFGWWHGADKEKQSAFLSKLSLQTESALSGALQKQNFYLLPAQMQKYAEALALPERGESLRVDVQQNLAQKYSAQIFIQGNITIVKGSRSETYQLVARVAALQAANGRVITEYFRSFETDRGPMETVVERKSRDLLESLATELSAQIVGVWQKGALGADMYRLTFQGGALGPLDVEAIKAVFQSRIRDVKSIRERSLSSSMISFEIDSPLRPEQFRQQWPLVQAGGKEYVAETDNIAEVIYTYRR